MFDILGFYWIDPNGGITNDAIKVYCEFHTNASCLYPGEESQVSWHEGRGGVVFTQLLSTILNCCCNCCCVDIVIVVVVDNVFLLLCCVFCLCFFF